MRFVQPRLSAAPHLTPCCAGNACQAPLDKRPVTGAHADAAGISRDNGNLRQGGSHEPECFSRLDYQYS